MSARDHNGGEPVNAPIFPKPPVILLLFLIAGFFLGRWMPFTTEAVPIENVVVGSAIVVCSIGIIVLAAREMLRARTSILPGAPANALIRSGVFKRSRNPIYLGLVLFMLGIGIATTNLWMIVLAPVLLLYLQERVVKREEAYLLARFGPEYIAYKRQTRRWF